MAVKEVKKSILEAGRNKIMELADYELEKVLANINDINTDAKKKRKITITLEFAPNDERDVITMISQVKSTIAPTAPASMTLFNMRDVDQKTGEVVSVLREKTAVAPGQFDLFGNIQKQEVFVIGMNAEKVIKKEKVENAEGEEE